MKLENKEMFLKDSSEALEKIFDLIQNTEPVRLNDFDCKKTALIIVDLVNGFTRQGSLKSDRVAAIIPEVVKLSKVCKQKGIPLIAFADSHKNCSPEFNTYPSHCLEDTEESEIVNELKELGSIKVIKKNSTNGFMEEEFLRWVSINDEIENFIVVGDCTDICIMQFALSLKTWFNMDNKIVNVIVPANAVETFESDTHNGDLSNAMAVCFMMGSGVQIVKNVEL